MSCEAECEVLKCTCPKCKKPVDVVWHRGVWDSPQYVLVADWVYHSKCWDELVAENPP